MASDNQQLFIDCASNQFGLGSNLNISLQQILSSIINDTNSNFIISSNNVINKPSRTKYMIRNEKIRQNRYIQLTVKLYNKKNESYIFYGCLNLPIDRRFRKISKPITKPVSLIKPFHKRIYTRTWNNAYGGDVNHVYIINNKNKIIIKYARSKPHWACECNIILIMIKGVNCLYIKCMPHPLCIEYCSGCDTFRPSLIDSQFEEYLELSAWKGLDIFDEYCQYHKLNLN